MKGNPTLKKLKLKDQDPVLIMNYPEEYQKTIDAIDADVHVRPKGQYSFVHLFVRQQVELSKYAEKAANCLDGDGYFWISYPKKSSNIRSLSADNRHIYNRCTIHQVAMAVFMGNLYFHYIRRYEPLNQFGETG